GPANCCFNPNGGGSASATTSNPAASPVLPSLQCILQQNNLQREEILKLIKYVEQTSGKLLESGEAAANDLLLISPTWTRERELQAQVIGLQESVESLFEELQRQKRKNVQ
ncbi:hypothetical protein OIU85_002104, partial [Salix viminalis]